MTDQERLATYNAARRKVVDAVNAMADVGAVVPLEQVVALLPVKPEWQEFRVPRGRRVQWPNSA